MTTAYSCDVDGVCLACGVTPPEEDRILCAACHSLWHAPCLSSRPASLADVPSWVCPDCTGQDDAGKGSKRVMKGENGGIVAKMLAIQYDASLSEEEKARRRQEVLGGVGSGAAVEEKGGLRELEEALKCTICTETLERPVTIPCGHNFCLKCIQNWAGRGKKDCPTCRTKVSLEICSLPRINSALVNVIREARTARSASSIVPTKDYNFIHNQNRPNKAFLTERAKKNGLANASSGTFFINVPSDHFGPILTDYDEEKEVISVGLIVGDTWQNRMECRQFGAHRPHVGGIAGQSKYGAQSVALSGGYEEDEDHGEWFLYTGSGGRDLSGNKRTNKEQSSDQDFVNFNEALRVSCEKGYPVRVVRSHKEKRSSYAPETGIRYDGVYRIEKCWRIKGAQGHKVCRYLFVRCDNAPAPWTSDEHGDRTRDLPDIEELNEKASDVFERKEPPAWGYDENHGWKWMKPPPPSRLVKQAPSSSNEQLLKEFSCPLCRNVLNLPMTTPCGHNFCKSCLDDAFSGMSFLRVRTREGGRALRQQKNIMKCPRCPTDISDFLQNSQVNTDLKGAIEALQKKIKEETGEASGEAVSEISDEPHETEGSVEPNEGELDIAASEDGYLESPSEAVENEEGKEKVSEKKLPKAAVKGRGKRKKAANETSKGRQGSKKAKKSADANDGKD